MLVYLPFSNHSKFSQFSFFSFHVYSLTSFSSTYLHFQEFHFINFFLFIFSFRFLFIHIQLSLYLLFLYLLLFYLSYPPSSLFLSFIQQFSSNKRFSPHPHFSCSIAFLFTFFSFFFISLLSLSIFLFFSSDLYYLLSSPHKFSLSLRSPLFPLSSLFQCFPLFNFIVFPPVAFYVSFSWALI